MEQHFEELGYTLTKAGNIPGFYTDLDTGKPEILFQPASPDSLFCF